VLAGTNRSNVIPPPPPFLTAFDRDTKDGESYTWYLTVEVVWLALVTTGDGI
jgi:hypothetical protein